MIGMENNNTVFHKNTSSLIIYLSNAKTYETVQPTSWSHYRRGYTQVFHLWLHQFLSLLHSAELKSRTPNKASNASSLFGFSRLRDRARMNEEWVLDKEKREKIQQQQHCLQLVWCHGDRHDGIRWGMESPSVLLVNSAALPASWVMHLSSETGHAVRQCPAPYHQVKLMNEWTGQFQEIIIISLACKVKNAPKKMEVI